MNKENEVIVSFVGFNKEELQLLDHKIQLPKNVTLVVGKQSLIESDLIVHRIPNVVFDEVPNSPEEIFHNSILLADKLHLLMFVQSFPFPPGIRSIMQNVEAWPNEVWDLRTFEDGDLDTTVNLLVLMLKNWYETLLPSLVTTAEIGNISLYDSRSRTDVFINGQPINFANSEYTLFKSVMTATNNMVSKPDLLRTVWHNDPLETLDTRAPGLNVLVFKVNTKLRQHGATHEIVSVSHQTYALREVSREDTIEEN